MLLLLQVPLGVILCIPPFNYPVNLAVSKIAPALMAGNTVVLKPPTQVPPTVTIFSPDSLTSNTWLQFSELDHLFAYVPGATTRLWHCSSS